MREENFREILEAEAFNIAGPAKAKNKGWVMEPERQTALLRSFWGKLTPNQSLVFFYCDKANAVDDSVRKLIVGIGRIKEVGEQLYFPQSPWLPGRFPVWSRRLTQDYPTQGVRLPYQEYIRGGHPTDGIQCEVPLNVRASFSFVSEHVSDDDAVSIIERVIQALERVKSEGKVPGDWERQIRWLNAVLGEVWSNRGPYPGLGAVLRFLGFDRAYSFHREVLVPMARKGENPLEFVRSLLAGNAKVADPLYQKGIEKAREEWGRSATRQNLLQELTRFDLSLDQVERLVNPQDRAASGITASNDDIGANPYLLCEQDNGYRKSQPVALETIDQGMLPEGEAVRFMGEELIRKDDKRRTRAVSNAVLKEAARTGDTILTIGELIQKITDRFPESRRCAPDPEIFLAEREFHEKRLQIATVEGIGTVSLKELAELERYVAVTIEKRIAKKNADPQQPINWRLALENVFGKPSTGRQDQALTEKETALKVLFRERISVLTGGAGTGKTSVIRILVEELAKVEGKQPLLLLAPTGKARVRLATKTKRLASTIHQFLLKQGWVVPPSFILRSSGSQPAFSARTVVIDECSMIPADLMGTLLKAIDANVVTRLVLVGDPNQLPPIGPGRPFVDIIDWLMKEHPQNLARLQTAMRASEDDESHSNVDSAGLRLADGFRTTDVVVDDDELLAAVARSESRNDLVAYFWDDHTDLSNKLMQALKEQLAILPGQYMSLNASFGYAKEKGNRDFTKTEAWQILSPTRMEPYGTEDLNRQIQDRFKGGLIQQCYQHGSNYPRPFGESQIVWSDKVMQTFNRTMDAWPANANALNYVANGEIGIVDFTGTGKSGGDYLRVIFSTQPASQYSYRRFEVDEFLETAYALTVHKAQGSDFDTVLFIIPQSATYISRELVYTALTRFRKKLILLIEKDIQTLIRMRNPDSSATRLRNSHLFRLAMRKSPGYPAFNEPLIHRTTNGVAVRSKSEVIVAEVFEKNGISFLYEQPLPSRSDPKDFRLPDFTISYQGDIFYWEHLGMLGLPVYREAWEKKRVWYEQNGYGSQLITSQDGQDGSIDAQAIEHTVKQRILGS
jgi:ATP-dependent exoDNAse (exonuclease V) alpha subunit